MQSKLLEETERQSKYDDSFDEKGSELKAEVFNLLPTTNKFPSSGTQDSQKKETLAILRINNEKKLLQNSFEIGILDKLLIQIAFMGQFEWRLGIRGKEGTLWEGGFYCATIKFPKNFPESPPMVTFDSDFEHIHIYSSGDICLDLVNKDLTYKPTVTMSLMIAEVNRLIHENPNPKSPANAELNQLYLNNREKYEARIKSNALRLKDKKLV